MQRVEVTIIPGDIYLDRLFWIASPTKPKSTASDYYFTTDDDLVYEPFSQDFGPLNLAMVYRYCTELEKLIHIDSQDSIKVHHYCSVSTAKKSNSAFLMGAFQILILGKSASAAWEPFREIIFPYYKDASMYPSNFQLSILNCLQGLERAVQLGWFNMQTFNVTEYEFHERVENGDFNWILPQKLLAFSCPSPVPKDVHGFRVWTPEDYAPMFNKLNVSTVVRLNQKTYDAERFRRLGIKHCDLFFVDGSCPTEALVKDFIKIVENEPNAVAVHCKAGLGRTGTMIGCYIMKHYNFPALALIGWMRICRPGSVLGPQQHFLTVMEAKCKEWNANSPRTPERYAGATSLNTEMTPEDKYKAKYGDRGQAFRLIAAKKRTTSASPNRTNFSRSPIRIRTQRSPNRLNTRTMSSDRNRPVIDANRTEPRPISLAVTRANVAHKSPFQERKYVFTKSNHGSYRKANTFMM